MSILVRQQRGALTEGSFLVSNAKETSMPKNGNLDTIKANFLRLIQDEESETNPLDIVTAAVHAVMRSQGATIHDASVAVTHWSVEAGVIPAELESDIEQLTEQMVSEVDQAAA